MILSKLRSDPEDYTKQFFEKGLSALLADPHFLLLYVPEDESKKMKIVRPATDLYHRKCMVKRINAARKIPSFYYALSHLWGISEENRYLWNDISEYVDDEQGMPVKPVSMRPEKRETLLALLKDHPNSYWWIDVLCARTNTPLDIMGDIYSCCFACIAMIDCEPSQIDSMVRTREQVDEIYSIMDSRTYGEISQKEYCQWWDYLFKSEQIGGAYTMRHSISYVDLYKRKYCQLLDHWSTFLQCRWWKRVWTWQELALPLLVCFISETGTHQRPLATGTYQQILTNAFAVSAVSEFEDEIGVILTHVTRVQELGDIEPAAKKSYPTIREIFNARQSCRQRISGETFGVFVALVDSLRDSPRQCMDPVDYVYGVLGMLQINIPRMSDPKAVWKHFLSELDKMINERHFISLAKQVDLRNANNIGDIFVKLSTALVLRKINKQKAIVRRKRWWLF